MTPPPIPFTLDGRPLTANPGETLWAAAHRHGITIPHLCHTPGVEGLEPAGNCRACVVEIEGERVLAASCCRRVEPGMQARAANARARTAQRLVLELLTAAAPSSLAPRPEPPAPPEPPARPAPPVGGPSGPTALRAPSNTPPPVGGPSGPTAFRDPKGPIGAEAPPTVAPPTQPAIPPQPSALSPKPSNNKHDNELTHWSRHLGLTHSRFTPRAPTAPDTTHPAFHAHLDACIQCTRCVRACRDVQGNDVIGLAFRGHDTRIVFDQADPLIDSTCVACGECVQACPTGALVPANGSYAKPAEKTVDSICPYCGIGCAITYHVDADRIVRVDGRKGIANEGRLCVKGRFGFDYAHHPDRLTVPLIRRDDAPKDPANISPTHWRELFREATWDEALARAAEGITRIRHTYGPRALAGFGSAKGSNEEAYLFQKLVRTGFGSNHVDDCTRLCHASSVAALLEGIGSGAVSNPVRDVAQAEVVLLIGANPSVNHPVGASWLKNAVRAGTRLILADPRRTELHRQAWRSLQFTPGTDIALLNALTHAVIDEGLADAHFIATRTRDFDALREHLQAFSPEAMAPVCGIPADTLREVARVFAGARSAMILWGMGISQHTHGTDNARALIALSLVSGQIGRPGTGLHPLRGQNNVQGASDAGLIPMMLPDYQRITDPAARARAETAWGLPPGRLDSEPGLTVVQIVNAAYERAIRGMLIQGENPAMSDPDAHHARQALARLEHLVVVDIFLTETAALADVVLPATAWPEKTGSVTNTDRHVQLGRKAISAPGQARADLWITAEIARRIGLNWAYDIDPAGGENGVGQVYEEMRGLMPSIAGITWDRLQREGAATYPNRHPEDPGQRVVFTDCFPTDDGLAHLVPAQMGWPAEPTDDEYPLVLITGRQLEHWHTGSMTRRSGALDALEPGPTVSVHPETMRGYGLEAGKAVRLRSRRGEVEVRVRADEGVGRGVVFLPFAYVEGAANVLTYAAIDPVAGIAEVKFCGVGVVL